MFVKPNLRSTKGKYFLFISAAILITGILSYTYIASTSARKQEGQDTGKTANNTNNAYASIASSDIDRVRSDGEFAWNLNDPYYFYNKYPVAALVHVDSIDGGRTYSPVSNQSVYPQTYGTIRVLKVYKGDVKSGQQLAYSRLGAIVTFDEYYNGLNQEQKDKYNYLSKGNKPAKPFIEIKFQDDIDIESGKNYIVFLNPQTSADGTHKEYSMEGMQYGLREVKGNVSGPDSGITIKNNKSGEWENPSSILKTK